MRYVSVFSGIEAASVAWGPLGWQPVCFCEVDEFPKAVLRHRFPSVPNLGDITKVDWRSLAKCAGRPDAVVGGSPCQSFSVAGSRTGLEGESGLMWEYVRAVRELMPRWLLWENVPGALSSSNGEDFRCLLESLDALGYGLAWRVLDAQFFGVAQRRERVFVVGYLGDPAPPAEVLFEPESLRWDTPTSREKRKELAAGAGGGAEAAGFRWNAGGKTALSVDETSPTVTSSDPPAVCAGFKWHQGSGAGGIGLEDEQSPTLTADYHNPAVIQLKGNAIDRDTSQNGRTWCDPDENGTYTLNATDVDGVICMADTQANSMIDEDVSGTVTAHAAKDAPVVAFAQNTRDEVRLVNGDGDISGALAANPGAKQTTYVAVDCRNHKASEDVSGTLQAKGNGGYSLNFINPVSNGSIVRRLTPTECERLQGFPDDWTRVPYKGKPEDECPDTPRYKAIGNSMAVPVMRWIGERMQKAEEACQSTL